MNEIMVSVVCDVFNHEDYLRECLDGIVMQQTNFAFEILIHDDASTDKSVEIIKEYVDKYPHLFKPIYQKENKFSKGISIWKDIQFPRAKGKYIAICEGDDYWTDPLKLQKQIDILEQDESLMVCCTNCSVVDNKGVELQAVRGNVVKDDIQGQYNLHDFFRDNHQYPTLSVVYRRTHIKEIEEKFAHTRNAFLGDWTLWICLMIYGDIYFLNEVTCAYRVNPTSITHSNVDARRLGLAKENFRLIPAIASILPDEYKDIKDNLTKETAWMWFNLANAYKHMHQYLNMAWCLFVCGIKDPRLLYTKLLKRK